MATVAYSMFLSGVLPRAGSAPEISALIAVRNAVIEFCSRTLIWSERQPSVDVTRTSFPMPLSAPEGARVAALLGVSLDGRSVPPVAVERLDAAHPDWDGVVGPIIGYYQPTPDSLMLVRLPESTGALRVFAAYTPTRTSLGVEEFIFEGYLEPIAAGALLRLTGDEKYRAEFEQGIRTAAVAARKSLTSAAVQIDLSAAR